MRCPPWPPGAAELLFTGTSSWLHELRAVAWSSNPDTDAEEVAPRRSKKFHKPAAERTRRLSFPRWPPAHTEVNVHPHETFAWPGKLKLSSGSSTTAWSLAR